MTPTSPIGTALQAVRARIAAAAAACGRDASAITLVAVSKTHPATAMQDAMAHGQHVFGENRVQEAAAKAEALGPAGPAYRMHLIGALQTNKAAEAMRVATTIESLDRPRLADAIVTEAGRTGRLPGLLIQVNIGDEPQKAGVATAEAPAFIRACQARFGDAVQGLMCIPPAGHDPVPFFLALARLRADAGLGVLSMGMSEDFEAAIACGATHVRVGSAIFGRRG